MSYETIPVEMKDSGTVHVLTGKISEINLDLSKADIDFDDYGLVEGIPIFYHCENEETADKGSGEEKIPFVKDDEVVVVNSGSVENLSASDMKIVGFADGLLRGCLTERVYVSMKSSLVSIQRCFVWDIKENTYAVIPDNEGNIVTFPCDPADISDWYDEQESVGEPLLLTDWCGRHEYSFFLLCGSSDSPLLYEESSECDPSFIDTASCEFTTSGLYDCRPDESQYGGIYYHQAEDSSRIIARHLIWGKTLGSQRIGSGKIIFKNNCDVESVFKVELTSEAEGSFHGAEDVHCELACDNLTSNTAETKNWQFISPFGNLLYEIDSIYSHIKDLCANTDQINHTNELVTWRRELKPAPLRLKPYGVYSGKNIAQAYFVEAQTRTSVYSGEYENPELISEEYTLQGLKLAAQVDTLVGAEYPDGTEGIDPTTLPRNEGFETAISGLYADIFEATTGWEEGDVLGAYLNQFLILKGVADL